MQKRGFVLDKNFPLLFTIFLIISFIVFIPFSEGSESSKTITASAGKGGSISPSGDVVVDHGSDQTFTITPDAGYEIIDVIVDGTSVGVRESYSFLHITKPHSIQAVFLITKTMPFPDATEGIHLFAHHRTHKLPSESAAQDLDFILHTLPFDKIPAYDETDGQSTIEKIHTDLNPDLPILMTRTIFGEPIAPAWNRCPWDKNPGLTKIPEWQEVNKYEHMFMHSTDPAGLVIMQRNGNAELFWSHDKRNGISHIQFSSVGYIVNRKAEGEAYKKITPNPVTGTSFVDTDVEDGNTYWYLVRSVDESGKSYGYSFAQSLTIEDGLNEDGLYNQEFTISDFEQFDNGFDDSFHTIPGTKPTFTFNVNARGDPRKVYLYFDLNNNKAFGRREKYTMTKTGTGYQISIPEVTIGDTYRGGFSYYFEADYGREDKRLPENEHQTFTTNINNRIRTRRWGNYLMRVGYEPWQEFFTSWTQRWINHYGYDGLFLDVVRLPGLGLAHTHCDAFPTDYVDDEQFNAKYDADKKEMVEFLRSKLGSKIIIINGMPDYSYLNSADGVMIEGFVYTRIYHKGITYYQTEDKWREQMDQYLKVSHEYDKAFLAFPAGIPKDNTDARIYSLASYLIGKGDKSYLYNRNEFLLSHPEYPEYSIPIGHGIEESSSLDDYYDASTKVYKRTFSNGLVLINPSEEVTTNDIQLSKDYYMVKAHGGYVSEGGYVEYVPLESREVSLPPQTAMILLETLAPVSTTTTTLSVTTTTAGSSTTTLVQSSSTTTTTLGTSKFDAVNCTSGLWIVLNKEGDVLSNPMIRSVKKYNPLEIKPEGHGKIKILLICFKPNIKVKVFYKTFS